MSSSRARRRLGTKLLRLGDRSVAFPRACNGAETFGHQLHPSSIATLLRNSTLCCFTAIVSNVLSYLRGQRDRSPLIPFSLIHHPPCSPISYFHPHHDLLGHPFLRDLCLVVLMGD